MDSSLSKEVELKVRWHYCLFKIGEIMAHLYADRHDPE
jgi:hypothetical protein